MLDVEVSIIRLVEHPPAMPIVDVANLRDVDLSGRAFQQTHTQPILKTGDSAAVIRFGKLRRLRRRGKSTVFYNVGEDGELVQISNLIIPHVKQYVLN